MPAHRHALTAMLLKSTGWPQKLAANYYCNNCVYC